MSKKQRAQRSPIGLVPRNGEKISVDEAAYLAKVFEGAQQAEKLMHEADGLEQQASQKRQQAVALLGAKDSYVVHLFEKFGLDTRTDSIDIDTREIRRMQGLPSATAAAEPETAPQD
jgi:hypothetical protein